MSKRFTDTDLWSEDWFLELTTEQKIFWFYVKDSCNHAGIWRVNKGMFLRMTGIKIDLNKFLSIVNNGKIRIEVISDDRWYLTRFISFQYGGSLNPNSSTHKSIINILNTYNIEPYGVEVKQTPNRPLKEVSYGVKDKDMDKDIKDKIKEGVGEKRKGAKKFQPPSVEEVIFYFKEKGYSVDVARRAFDYYNEASWVDSQGHHVLNWKQKMNSVWFKEENKVQSTPKPALICR